MSNQSRQGNSRPTEIKEFEMLPLVESSIDAMS
jgi:hypothetical protein